MSTRLLHLSALILSTAASACGAAIEYTPQRIEQLIKEGRASSSEAQFKAIWGTCFWKESGDHQVWFFLREGKSYGEFRDEVLSEGRFLRIIENYLVADAGKLPRPNRSNGLHFVRRDEEMIWTDGKWTGSTIKWSFVWCTAEGIVLRSEAAPTERTFKRNLTLQVPAHFTRSNLEYHVKMFRAEETAYEKSFARKLVDGRYYIGGSKVSDGSCPLRIDVVASRPELLFELHERIPNPPGDANPDMVRTKCVASMTLKVDPLKDQRVHFDPDKAD